MVTKKMINFVEDKLRNDIGNKDCVLDLYDSGFDREQFLNKLDNRPYEDMFYIGNENINQPTTIIRLHLNSFVMDYLEIDGMTKTLKDFNIKAKDIKDEERDRYLHIGYEQGDRSKTEFAKIN